MNQIRKTIFAFLTFFFCCTTVFASTKTGYVDATLGLIVRENAGTSYKKIETLSNKTVVTIKDTKNTADSSTGCPNNVWYYITSGDITGYVCSQYIIITDNGEVSSSEIANMTDKEFEEYLKNQGFPSSYWSKIKALHKAHPNWVFKAVKSKYTWSNALSKENEKGRSLYQVTSTGIKNGLQGYLNTGSAYYNYSTDKFTALDGSTWFQANSQTIAYYMDPRNFLTEAGIFMFEDLTYFESYQTEEVVKKILYTDFYKDYTKYYIEAAKKYNVSPVYLATLSRQEVGLNSSTATSGKAGTYNNVDYNGYYNFYNIGASSGSNPVYNGLAYSKEASWNSVQKAIVEGAGWIVKGYISRGQYTRYFQKWNVSPTTATDIWHQYATDIKTTVSPSATAAASYNSMGIINEALVFTIPIFEGMPKGTSLPPTGNPNNWLKTLKIDGVNVNNFSGSTTSYNLGTVEYSKSSIKIETTTVNSNADVDGDGTVNLQVGKNNIKILVTAQNGSEKTYTLTIVREENKESESEDNPITEISISKILNNLAIKNNQNDIYGFKLGTTATTLSQNILKQNSNGKVAITDKNNKTKTSSLATGDKVTITSNGETKTYQVVIYGDLNGDSKISPLDLLALRKHLLKEQTLSGSYFEAAKLNNKNSSSLTPLDLLALRNHLLEIDLIKQI